MGYILMQPDDSTEARAATSKLLNKREYDFDLSSDGARLRPVLFNSRSCTATEKHYHGCVGEIACGRWAIGMEKRYLWGTHFFWLCDMKTTYRIMHYTGPIHILRRWYQELLAYNFSCIHRSYLMMIDVDYLSRMHNELIKSHVSIANRLSLSDRATRPEEYSETILDYQLQRGKYSVKNVHATVGENDAQVHTVFQGHKRQKLSNLVNAPMQCSSPIILQYNTQMVRESKWRWNKEDNILLCDNIQPCRWLSIDLHHLLFDGIENSCITPLLQH